MRINESERETVIGVGREGDGAIEMQAKLDVIIKNGSWFWPHARSDELVEVQSKLFEVEIGATDLPIWNSKSDQYNCADTWELLREKWPVVGWWKLIWFPNAIPRHSFIMWLVFYDALVCGKYFMPFSVMDIKKAVNTFSLGVVSVGGYGLV
jgi:hypothetical protein